jgi:hypothetical protein
MRPHLFACLSALVVLSTPVLSRRQDPAAVAALADARTALGGDAALTAVTSFVATGSLTRYVADRALQSDIEFDCVLPAQCVRVEHRAMPGGPTGGFAIHEWHGFNGDALINRTEAPGAPFPVTFDPNPPKTPQEAADRTARLLDNQRRAFARMTLALFATTLHTYPVTYAPATSPGAAGADVSFDVKGAGGFLFRLSFDGTTHLPARIAWMASPIVSGTTTRSTAVSARGTVITSPPRVLPMGDPTAGLGDVAWQLSIEEFRIENGLNWPHRLSTMSDGAPYEDIKIAKYKINVKIDPKKFKTVR